jgi:CBS domain containing-hemolysin-like protein
MESGQIHERESQILHNLFGLDKVHTSDIMTPRTVMFTLPAAMPLTHFLAAVADKPFTRIPVYGTEPDSIVGFVIKSEVLTRLVEQGPETTQTLADVARPLVDRAGPRCRSTGPSSASSRIATRSCWWSMNMARSRA